MNPVLADGVFQAAPQDALYDTPKGGDQTEEAEAVGEHTRCDEERSRNQDDRGVDKRARREPARRHLRLYLTQHTEPLSSGERRTAHPGQYDQSEGVQRAEAASQLDQQRELDGGKNDEEEKESTHFEMMPQRAGRSSPV